jgi:hypothetical protein
MSNDGGGKGNGGGDQGRGGRNGRNKNPPAKGSGSTPSTKFKGQLKDLPDDTFDFGSKGVADQMRRTWEKIVNHAGSAFGSDIGVELGNRSKLVIPKPQDDPEDLARHEDEQKVLRETRTKDLEAAIVNLKELNDEQPKDRVQILSVTSTINRLNGELKLKDKPYEPSGKFKDDYKSAKEAYDKRVLHLNIHRGKVFSIIRGQCSPALIQKLKADHTWKEVSKDNQDPLALFDLIERITLSYTEETYDCTHRYDQNNALMSFRQNNLSILDYYDQFVSKIKVARALRSFNASFAMYENDAQRLHSKGFFDLDEEEMEEIREVSEERYLGYHFVRNSGPQHSRYRTDLSNQFAQGKNNYPQTLQEAYDVLQRYEKNPTAHALSEGTAFAQYQGKRNQNQDKGKKGKKTKKKDENATPASQQRSGAS